MFRPHADDAAVRIKGEGNASSWKGNSPNAVQQISSKGTPLKHFRTGRHRRVLDSNWGALNFETIHRIRTSGLPNSVLAREIGVSEYSIRAAKYGWRYGNHPTPPVPVPSRGGWKKPQPAAPFTPEVFSLQGEEWRPVVGWEKYYRVSNMGRVYSLHQSGRFCIGMPMEGGYRVVKVRDKERRGHIAVHCMVLEAFVGPRPSPEHEGCHNNGKPPDNRLSNLRWDTPAGNAADKVLHGTNRYRGTAGLDAEKVRQIRATPEVTLVQWAQRFGVSRAAISSARAGHTWKEVDTPPLRKRA